MRNSSTVRQTTKRAVVLLHLLSCTTSCLVNGRVVQDGLCWGRVSVWGAQTANSWVLNCQTPLELL